MTFFLPRSIFPVPSPLSMKVDMGVQWNLILMHLLDTAGGSYNDLGVKRVMALFCYIYFCCNRFNTS